MFGKRLESIAKGLVTAKDSIALNAANRAIRILHLLERAKTGNLDSTPDTGGKCALSLCCSLLITYVPVSNLTEIFVHVFFPDQPTKSEEEDLPHQVRGVEAATATNMSLSIFSDNSFRRYVTTLDQRHLPPHKAKRLQLLQSVECSEEAEVKRIVHASPHTLTSLRTGESTASRRRLLLNSINSASSSVPSRPFACWNIALPSKNSPNLIPQGTSPSGWIGDSRSSAFYRTRCNL